ncbi:MAG: hypothetical protein Kow0062_24500 [Acidobacteriota bacterium]
MSSDKPRLGVRLGIVLALLTIVFGIVVYLAQLDAERLTAAVQAELDRQNRERTAALDAWYERISHEHARELAAPFLWDVATLEGVEEGTPAHARLQRRMWQFVYGKDEQPQWEDAPVGPLESVVIIDLDHRIVAASDPMVVDQRFTDPAEIERLDRALVAPQLDVVGTRPRDGQPVHELTVAVPNAAGEPIGFVRMRYVGGELTRVPALPRVQVSATPRLWGPLLAGVLALLGVGFGALATVQVINLTRRLEAMAEGQRVGPHRGPGERALSIIEQKLESLSSTVRHDDLLVSSLTEALREGVVLVDPERRTVVANRLARELLGLPADQQADPAAAFFALLERSGELAEIVDSGLARGEAVREAPLAIERDGEPVDLRVTSYVLAGAERPAGLMLLLKDERSIRTLERNLRQASRFETIVQLTGSVAHEVKNPLGAIEIHLEHLRRRLARAEDGDPRGAERVSVIREEIGRLREILEEWLRFTSPEERARGPAEVRDVLRSVVRLLRVEARHQGVELELDEADDAARVGLAPARLRQVLLNLAINALQAMPDGGRLVLRSRQAGALVMLEVEDTGPGIPAELREQVFDMHFTTRAGGSGLGLPICRRIVEEAGGHITFVSTPGRGTVFRVVLPLASLVTRRDGGAAAAGR